MTGTTEELLEQPSAADVNEDNYGDHAETSAESEGMSALSLPASLATDEELAAIYDDEQAEEARNDELDAADPGP